MKKNEIAREVSAILSKEYGGSSKRSFQLARSIVKLVADRITKGSSDGAYCEYCKSNTVYDGCCITCMRSPS